MIRYDCPPREYHLDLDGPRLSSTTAHRLLTLSPLHARHYDPRLGANPFEATDEMDRGNLIDTLLLGRGRDIEIVIVVDKDTGEVKRDWRTKEAKQKRVAAREAGKLPVLQNDYEDALGVVDVIKARIARCGVSLDGKSQVALYWETYASNGNAVKCRGLLDHLCQPAPHGLAEVWDLKTIASAHPDAIQKAIEKRDYHVQAAAYLEGLCAEFPELQGREQYGLIFAETDGPMDVVPVRLGGDLLEIGQARWRRAVDLWEECLREDRWPGYAHDQVITINASRWAQLEHEGWR